MQRVALVTGAGSGVGRAVARVLLTDGYAVALAGRRSEPLAGTAADFPEAMVIPTDVTSPESVDALFAAVRDRWGRLDVLFNNAGIGAPAKPFDELTLAEWTAVVDTNLTGTFLCAQRAFALMRTQQPRGGRIINNGSVSAQAPRPRSAAYTATKHAVTGLTKSLSLDGREFGIACSQIDIGNAETDMTRRMGGGVPQADGSIRPEPTMEVRHVAEAVRYMAGLPLSANVPFMTVMATAMPLVGRG